MSAARDPRFAVWHLLVVSLVACGVARAELRERLPVTASRAAQNAADTVPEVVDAPDLSESRREIQQRLARVAAQIEQRRGDEAEEDLVREAELLKWIDVIYSSYQTTTEQYRELQQEAKQLDDELRTIGLAAKPPSYIQLDELRDRMILEDDRKESIQLEIDAARVALQVARDSKNENDARRRSARDAVETDRDPVRRERARRESELQQLSSRAYALTVEQLQLELKIMTLELQISGRRGEWYVQQVERWREKTAFSEADLQAKIEQVNRIDAWCNDEIERSQTQLQAADARWIEAQRGQVAVSDQGATVEGGEVAAEQLAAWRQARDLLQEQLSFLKQALAYTGHVRNVWRQRHQLANHAASRADYTDWLDAADAHREDLKRFQRLMSIRANEHLGDAAVFKKRLLELQGGRAELVQWIQHQADELEAAIAQYTSLTVMLKSADRLLQRFHEDLRLEIDPASARQAVAYAGQLVQTAWNYEITSVDDRPITVKKVCYGILLLVVGFVSARMLSRVLGRRVLPKLGLAEGAAQAFQSIAFYLMLTCFGVLVLDMINIPLTVFAFMGGAIAIGVGFGSQNILNNFISGLIVLAERPIRVGDLVEISGLTGTIERIGARSTRVKTGANLEIIVPNSTFLENNVTNWTLSDTRTRRMVSVGVAYGSPTQDVHRLLRQAAEEHPMVLKTPEPIVLFKEFGDNSLLFETHFWVNMRTMMQAQKTASDIRHRIDALFAEAEISIAFPQRDVHLDTIAPIEVSLRHVDGAAEFLRRHPEAA